MKDKQRNKHKYEDDYIEFGFIAIETEDPQISFCVVYKKVLSNEAAVPNRPVAGNTDNHLIEFTDTF